MTSGFVPEIHLHLRAQFLDGVERREVDRDRVGDHRPVIGGDMDRDVGEEQADPVAHFLMPALLQPGCEGQGLGVDFRPGITTGPAELDQAARRDARAVLAASISGMVCGGRVEGSHRTGKWL